MKEPLCKEEMERELPHLGLSRNEILEHAVYVDEISPEDMLYLLHHGSDRDLVVTTLFLGLTGDRRYSMEEIGACFGVSRERIRQIVSKVIHILYRRHFRKRRRIRDFYK